MIDGRRRFICFKQVTGVGEIGHSFLLLLLFLHPPISFLCSLASKNNNSSVLDWTWKMKKIYIVFWEVWPFCIVLKLSFHKWEKRKKKKKERDIPLRVWKMSFNSSNWTKDRCEWLINDRRAFSSVFLSNHLLVNWFVVGNRSSKEKVHGLQVSTMKLRHLFTCLSR